jgi:hypothetical protein
MKPSIVRCSNQNYLCVLIRMREILHFRQTLSTGKIQILQLPFCNKVGLNTFTDYNLPKIEDGNDRVKLIIKDMKTYPHHYDEDDEDEFEPPDHDETEWELNLGEMTPAEPTITYQTYTTPTGATFWFTGTAA